MDAQHAVEGVIRIVGFVTLFALTFGRYGGPKDDALLLEGGVGLLVVVAVIYAAVVLG